MQTMVSGRSLAGTFLSGCILCAAPAGRTVIHFRRIAEPREGAFTMLVPDGWLTQGGVFRVDPGKAGGAGNSVAAKVDFTIMRDAAGTVMVRTLPDRSYKDMRNSPAAAMFPPGSNYNGMVVSPPMDAMAFLTGVLFRNVRPRAQGVQILARVPLPEVARSYDQVCRRMGLPADYRNNAALVLVAYQEGDIRYKEVMYTDVQMMLAGTWCTKDSYMARAPFAEFERTCPIFRVMQESVRLDPAWVGRELHSQTARAKTIANVQQEVQRLDAEIVQHRQTTNATINEQVQMLLHDQAKEIDPHTGRQMVIPANQGSVFYGRNGDALLVDDPEWDPARDPRFAGGDYQKSRKGP